MGLLAVLALAFPLGLSAQSGVVTWAGTWDTNLGNLTLNASGSGTYTFCNGTISGSVSGNKLTGTWTQKAGCAGALEPSGDFEFTMVAGGTQWDGRWRYAGTVASTAWRYGWYATSCKSGPCLKNGAEATRPEAPIGPIRKGLVNISIKNGRFSVAKFNIASGSTLRICNKEPFFRESYTLPKTGPNAFRVRLRPGACLTHKLVNRGKGPLKLSVFDEINSRMKLTIMIYPAK